MDGPMDRPTDGQTLLYRCDDASKNSQSWEEFGVITPTIRDTEDASSCPAQRISLDSKTTKTVQDKTKTQVLDAVIGQYD